MENEDKIILDLCGGTGSWSKPYRDAGYDVRLITHDEYDVLGAWFEASEKTNYKTMLIFQNQLNGDKMIIDLKKIYGIFAAPPCTHFSFARSTGKTPRDLEGGMKIVKSCLEIIWRCQYYNLPSNNAKRTNLQFWALENPYGLLRRFLGKPAMIFNPWQFGDMYQKKTCLWGFFNEPKPVINEYKSTKFDKIHARDLPKLPEGYILPDEYKGNNRAARRAVTPKGFAEAFYKVNR